MIDVTIFVTSLFISMIFLGLGFFKKQYFFVLLGGIFMGIVGALLLNGLRYTSGVNITTVNNTFVTVQDIISVDKTIYTTGLSIFIMLVGVAMIIISIMLMVSKSADDDRVPDEDLYEES